MSEYQNELTFERLLLCPNLFPAKVIYLNFHPLKVVSRYRVPQL